MTGFKTIVHQGWHSRRYSNAKQEDNPYPKGSQSAKEWLDGWWRANDNKHWNTIARFKPKKVKQYA